MVATATAAPTTTVRPYRASDRDAVRDIACRTAFRNRGHAVFVDDRELFADYWTRYYTDYEPDAAWVAERDGHVVGYVLGCVDTRRLHRVMARHIVPPVVLRLVWRGVSGRYRNSPGAGRFFSWFVTRSWREAPSIDLDRYPAHYHCNVLRPAYGEGLYTQLASAFLEHARSRGVTGMHGQVLDRRDGGVWQRMVDAFIAAHPHVRFDASARATTIGAALLGDTKPLVNRAFGASIHDYATFLDWMRRWRHL